MARSNKSARVCQIVLTPQRFDIEIESVLGVAYMLLQAPVAVSHTAHVIVLGNEKGGSGKSTTAMHVAVALLKAGQRVATIDLDSRQKTFTNYVENRRAWARRARIELELPTHYHVRRGEGVRVDENENT